MRTPAKVETLSIQGPAALTVMAPRSSRPPAATDHAQGGLGAQAQMRAAVLHGLKMVVLLEEGLDNLEPARVAFIDGAIRPTSL